MISEELLDKVLSAYFKTGVGVDEISEGLTNYNYRIREDSGRITFLKLFRRAKIERVKGIVELTRILRKNNFPTPEIIPTLKGNGYWEEGPNSAILTEYIKGRYPEKNHEDLFQIGNVLGALHLVPPGNTLSEGYPLSFDILFNELKGSGSFIEEDLEGLIEKSLGIILGVNKKVFDKSIVHGDVFLDNLLVTEFGDLYFVDFEGGCVDKSIFDLSRAVIGCCINHNKIDIGLTKALISGYDLIRDLPGIEREFMYDYIVYAGVVSTLWRYSEFYIKRKDENKSGIYRKLLNPVRDFLNIKKEDFNSEVFQVKY